MTSSSSLLLLLLVGCCCLVALSRCDVCGEPNRPANGDCMIVIADNTLVRNPACGSPTRIVQSGTLVEHNGNFNTCPFAGDMVEIKDPGAANDASWINCQSLELC